MYLQSGNLLTNAKKFVIPNENLCYIRVRQYFDQICSKRGSTEWSSRSPEMNEQFFSVRSSKVYWIQN